MITCIQKIDSFLGLLYKFAISYDYISLINFCIFKKKELKYFIQRHSKIKFSCHRHKSYFLILIKHL